MRKRWGTQTETLLGIHTSRLCEAASSKWWEQTKQQKHKPKQKSVRGT